MIDLKKTFKSKTFYIFLNMLIYATIGFIVFCGGLRIYDFLRPKNNVNKPEITTSTGNVTYINNQNAERLWSVHGGIYGKNKSDCGIILLVGRRF